MELIHPKAEAYAAKYSSQEDELLAAIHRATVEQHPQPHMISGPLQGKFLEIISRLQRPRRILEIGTMVGYSTLCLAKGLSDDGIIHTIELREKDASRARQNFEQAGISRYIQLHVGNALDIIPQLNEEWDLVFIDADKVSYLPYYELVKPRLKKGGLLLADNVLFHGEVLHDEVKGKNAKAIHAFNEHVAADAEVEKVLITMRDGLFLIRKK